MVEFTNQTGILMDKFGSRVLAAAALCLLVGGYLLVWAAGSALLPSWACSAWVVTAYFLIIGVGNTATVSGSLVLCTRNFPHQARGKVCISNIHARVTLIVTGIRYIKWICLWWRDCLGTYVLAICRR